MVTIKQVADAAGTSFKTVSRVINNDKNVSKATKSKVLKAIKELGYRPNRAAQMMRNQKSGVIGFIADQVSVTPQAIDIVRGAQEVAWEMNKQLMVLNIRADDDSRDKAIEQLLEYRAEGIIYAAMYHKPVSLPPALLTLPTVLVNCFSENAEVASVVPDDYRAALEITRELLKKGYKKLVFLNLNARSVAAKQRQSGFIDALEQAGISSSEQPVFTAVIENNGIEHSICRDIVHKLCKQNTIPDAILCGQDSIAMECYFALQELGLKVGKDIGIASFDNMLPVAELLKPGLSTMSLPHFEMGQWGINYLLAGRRDPVQTRLPCTLIERKSY